MLTRPRPDRTTLDGMIWNGECEFVRLFFASPNNHRTRRCSSVSDEHFLSTRKWRSFIFSASLVSSNHLDPFWGTLLHYYTIAEGLLDRLETHRVLPPGNDQQQTQQQQQQQQRFRRGGPRPLRSHQRSKSSSDAWSRTLAEALSTDNINSSERHWSAEELSLPPTLGSLVSIPRIEYALGVIFMSVVLPTGLPNYVVRS